MAIFTPLVLFFPLISSSPVVTPLFLMPFLFFIPSPLSSTVRPSLNSFPSYCLSLSHPLLHLLLFLSLHASYFLCLFSHSLLLFCPLLLIIIILSRLKEYLSRAEQSLTAPSLYSAAASLHPPLASHRGAVQDSFFDGASFLSPSNGFGAGVAAASPQGIPPQLAQMEKPDFVYKVGISIGLDIDNLSISIAVNFSFHVQGYES